MCSPGSYRPLRRDRTCAATRGRGLCAGGSVTVTGLIALPSRRDEAWPWSRLAELPELADARHGGAGTAAQPLNCLVRPRMVLVHCLVDHDEHQLGRVLAGATQP